MQIRPADPDRDAAAIAEIYRPNVDPGLSSFETVPPSAEEMARRIREYGEGWAYLVAEAGGEVAGYAYGGRHRARDAYAWSVETSIFVRADQHGRGVGRALYGALLPALAERGYRMAFAGITLPNAASVALHERVGFVHIGVFNKIGYKAGAWRDVGWWQRELVPGEAPPTPVPASSR